MDPIGGDPRQPQSWNAFSYVLNNPINLVDPYGLVEATFHGNWTVTGDEPDWYRNLMMQRRIERDFSATQAYWERTRTDETMRKMLSVAGGVMPRDFEDNWLTEFIADHFSGEGSIVVGTPIYIGGELQVTLDRTGLHANFSIVPAAGASASLVGVGLFGPGRSDGGTSASLGGFWGGSVGGGIDIVNYGGKNNQQIRFKLGLVGGGSGRFRMDGSAVPASWNLF